MTLKYTNEAVITEAILFADVNDINIFVEDTNKEYEYETIFKRMFKKKYKIKKIFAVGGKKKLKEKFVELKDLKMKNIFIADGDFDRYIDKEKMIDNPYFIYLKTYNIENYFIDKRATEKFVKGKLKLLDSEIKNKVSFNEWKTKIVSQISELFFYYCYVQKKYPEKPTISQNTYKFIDSSSGFEIKNEIKNYKEEVELFSNNSLKNEIGKIKRDYYNENQDNGFNLICGKFLFTSLYCYVRSIIKSNFKKEDFRWHLISNFDIKKLDYLKEKINIIINKKV